jgi:HlyD family secretion protein
VALLQQTFAAPGAEQRPPDESTMAVSVAHAKSECFTDTVQVLGTVVPRREILVRPDREGLQIKEILAEAGDTVTSAQVLARLATPNDPQNAAATSILAPASGTLLSAPAVSGEMATARGEPLFRIMVNSDTDLSADVPAKDASRLTVGQKAKIKVAGTDESLGQVRLVSTMIDPATQLGQVRVALQRNPSFRVGAFARAIIETERTCGVSIPQSALLFGPDGAVVQVVKDNRVETHLVSVGLFALDSVQIRQGLSEGEMIVARAGAFLRDGDRVRPVSSGK